MTQVSTYALVTPARDEEANLRRLARCLTAQTITPMAWIVVDDGSTDGTASFIEELRAERPWVSLVRLTAGTGAPAPGAPVVRAVNAGLKALTVRPDVVVKLDADVSFDDDHFARLLGAFDANPRLGIASGDCLELEDGVWMATTVSPGHARGAVRAYRAACLAQVTPLAPHVGWDGIDELKARVLGWTTGIVPDLSFHHHRALGERDGASHRRWMAQGRGAHFMGYRPSFLLLRSLHRARRDPAAMAMLWGYAEAKLKRQPVHGDQAVRAHLRELQRLRNLRRRSVPH